MGRVLFNLVLLSANNIRLLQCDAALLSFRYTSLGIKVNYDTMRCKGALQKIISTELFLWATSVIF